MVSPKNHANPHHPDAGGKQQSEAKEYGLDPPTLTGSFCVAVAVGKA